MSTLPVSLDIPNPKDFERFVPRETHLNWGKSRYVDPWVSLVKSLRESPGHSAVVVQAPEDKVKIKAAPLVANSKEKTNFEGAMEGLSTTPEQQTNNSRTEIIPPDNVEVRIPPEAPNTKRHRGPSSIETLERRLDNLKYQETVVKKRLLETPSKKNSKAVEKVNIEITKAEAHLQERRKGVSFEVSAQTTKKKPQVKHTPAAPRRKSLLETPVGKVSKIAQNIERRLQIGGGGGSESQALIQKHKEKEMLKKRGGGKIIPL